MVWSGGTEERAYHGQRRGGEIEGIASWSAAQVEGATRGVPSTSVGWTHKARSYGYSTCSTVVPSLAHEPQWKSIHSRAFIPATPRS
jgi:hypothetical protein